LIGHANHKGYILCALLRRLQSVSYADADVCSLCLVGGIFGLQIIPKINVFERDGKQWTTSLNVAEVFGKDHKHILEKIDNLECSEQFNQTNFRPVEYQDRKGEMRRCFELSRDGFSFLVMGFTGAKAAQFKEA
jgi:Rha family phage regulatory protein